jgi:hypothetical protein
MTLPPVSRDSFIRWQDRSRSGIEFFNNLIIVLATGLIAVALNQVADAANFKHLPHWQRVCAGVAVFILGVSVLAGMGLALNRLRSARLTARQIRLRDLRDAAFKDAAAKRSWRGMLDTNIGELARRGDRPPLWRWSQRPVRSAAAQYIDQSSQQDAHAAAEQVNMVITELRELNASGDRRTWGLLYAQLVTFVAGALLFVVVLGLNYFS